MIKERVASIVDTIEEQIPKRVPKAKTEWLTVGHSTHDE